MAFLGFESDLNWKSMRAGEYYVVNGTGEVFDSEHQAEEACFEVPCDENGEEIEDAEPFQIDTYRIQTVTPFYVTRQGSFYRAFNSVNIGRDRDNFPPGMYCGTDRFPEVTECETREEAISTAKAMALAWARVTGEPIQVEGDTAEWGGDTEWTALPTGLLFEGEPDGLEEAVPLVA